MTGDQTVRVDVIDSPDARLTCANKSIVMLIGALNVSLLIIAGPLNL